jgi:hypothetical protein
MLGGMSKQSPRPSVRELASFDIRSIPKKPFAPSLDRRRSPQDAFRTKVKTGKGKQCSGSVAAVGRRAVQYASDRLQRLSA